MLQAGRFETQWGEFFSIYVILPAALGPGIYSASNRNEYQKQKNILFLESRARPVRRADNLTVVREPIVYEVWDPQHLTTL
jgi:hypothetical protein